MIEGISLQIPDMSISELHCCYTLSCFNDFQLCVFQYLVWFNACLQAVDILFIEYKIELVADQ